MLALGDSLAAGYQPTFGSSLPPVDPSDGLRDRGYPDGYARDLASARGLVLTDLACPGETSASFLATPAEAACGALYGTGFGASSQLGAAESFLGQHKGQVALLTIDLGANDLIPCVKASSVSASCFASADVEMEANLEAILGPVLSTLHRDDPKARAAAMTYYDPFLGLAFDPGGATGLKGASASLLALEAVDAELAATYRGFGLAVANVAGAFDTTAATPIERYRGHLLAADVVSVCQLTWMCPASGGAADIHPKTAGYRTIASAFKLALSS